LIAPLSVRFEDHIVARVSESENDGGPMKAIVALTIVGSGGAILELESVFVARGPIIVAGEKQAGSQIFDHDLHKMFCSGSVSNAIAQRTG
jgi:hypothetical protein